MATAHLTTTTVVERLATTLDQLAADRWDDPAATYAWVDSADQDLRIGPPPATRVRAVAVTCLGTARRVGDRAPEQRAVRVTVAVSCCGAAARVRSLDGQIDLGSTAEGVTVATLRRWAALDRCAKCAPEHCPAAPDDSDR